MENKKIEEVKKYLLEIEDIKYSYERAERRVERLLKQAGIKRHDTILIIYYDGVYKQVETIGRYFQCVSGGKMTFLSRSFGGIWDTAIDCRDIISVLKGPAGPTNGNKEWHNDPRYEFDHHEWKEKKVSFLVCV